MTGVDELATELLEMELYSSDIARFGMLTQDSMRAGRLEIERIRADAEQALGESFDVRHFHDVVVGGGALPLPVLDAVVTEWRHR